MISKCPKCGDQVSIPDGVIAEAIVRCPVCAAEYPLADALASAPPMLVVVDLGPGAAALGAAAPAVAAAPAEAAWLTDAPAIETPVAADDLDRWLSPEPSESEQQAGVEIEPVAGTIGLEHEAEGVDAEEAAGLEHAPVDEEAELTITTEDTEHAATDDDMFALVGHADESDTAEIGEDLFAESDKADAEAGASADEAPGELRLHEEGETAPPSETLEADEAFAGFAAVQETQQADSSTAAKMRRKRGKGGNPAIHIVGVFGGAVVGLFLGYYVLNFFWGKDHDYLGIWLPGVAHTADHRPTWLGGGKTSEAAKSDANNGKPSTLAKAGDKEPQTPPDTTPTTPDTGTTDPSAPGDTTGIETPKPEPSDTTGMTPTEPVTPKTTPGATDPFEMPKIDIAPPVIPKEDTPKVDEPKPEMPKVDEPKPEMPKVDEPKPEMPKVDEPKPETTPADPFGITPPKPDTPKVDEPKVDEPKPEMPKVDEPKPEMPADPFGVTPPKPDTPKVDEPKPESPKVDEPKPDMPKVDEPKPETPKVEEPAAPGEMPKPDTPKVDEPKIDVPMPESPKIDEPKVESPKVDTPKPETPKVDEPKVDTPAATIGPKNPPAFTAEDLSAAVKEASAAFQAKSEMTPEVYAKFARVAEVATYAKDDAAKLATAQAEVTALLEKVARADLAGEIGKLAAQQLKSAEGPKGGVLVACVMGKEFSKDGLFGATIETLGDPHRTPVFNNKTFAIEPGKQVFILGCVLADPANNLAGTALTKPWIIWSGPTVAMPQ